MIPQTLPAPALAPHAPNLTALAHAHASARRSDPAAVDRLARWLAEGRRMMETPYEVR